MNSPLHSTVDITIESLGGLGDGIGTLASKPVFVSKSCAGDRLNVRIVHENRDGFTGVITNIIAPGPERIAPPCAHFSECGGCTLQQLSQDAYRAFKTRIFQSALERSGAAGAPQEIIFLPAASRRRAEFKIASMGSGVALAFYELRSNVPVAITHCHIVEPDIQALIAPLNAALSALPFAQDIKSVSLTLADSGMDILVTLKNTVSSFEPLKTLAKNLPVARISVRLPDESLHSIAQNGPVEMTLGDYQVALPPDVFLQAAQAGQETLTSFVMEASTAAASIADLFSGIGTYAFPLSRNANVYAVEGEAALVGAMQTAIKQHGITSMQAAQRDLFKSPLTTAELNRFDIVIINPPRLGARAQVEQLAQSGVKKIIMVSCNPATFIRDANILIKSGFGITRALGLDQFVWSPHLEIAAVFTR